MQVNKGILLIGLLLIVLGSHAMVTGQIKGGLVIESQRYLVGIPSVTFGLYCLFLSKK